MESMWKIYIIFLPNYHTGGFDSAIASGLVLCTTCMVEENPLRKLLAGERIRRKMWKLEVKPEGSNYSNLQSFALVVATKSQGSINRDMYPLQSRANFQ